MVTILTYHGVTDGESSGIENFQGKHMATGTFERQMRYLRGHENILKLGDVVEAYTRGRDLDGVVVTFDDGYRNSFTVAFPILEEIEIPVTFFFSTGFIGSDRMFWVDEVEFWIDRGEVEGVDLTEFGLRPYALVSREEKMEVVTEIKAFLKRVDDGAREAILGALKTQLLPLSGGEPSPNYKTLTWVEVRALAQSPLVEVGGHSVDHAILSRVSREQLRYQVRESKRDLERHLDREITLFAYPNGGPDDYNAEVIEVVREEGFTCGCTTLPGRNSPSVSLFELRRSMVGFCGAPFPFPAATGM